MNSQTPGAFSFDVEVSVATQFIDAIVGWTIISKTNLRISSNEDSKMVVSLEIPDKR